MVNLTKSVSYIGYGDAQPARTLLHLGPVPSTVPGLLTHDVDETVRPTHRIPVLTGGRRPLDVAVGIEAPRLRSHPRLDALRSRLLAGPGSGDVAVGLTAHEEPARSPTAPIHRNEQETSTMAITETRLDVTPLSGNIGAEIRGVDLRHLDADTVAEIRKVWLDRKVVFFPGQDLDQEAHLAFASWFGELTEGHPVIPGVDGYPNVFEIDYSKARELYASYGDVSTRTQGLDWHTDVTFVERPPLGSILRAVVVPPSGGDTAFSNQQAAFEALSPTLQGFLETLTAVHDGQAAFQSAFDRLGPGKWEGEKVVELQPVVHPVVRTHPETGAKGLFVNPGFTSHIVELRRAESDALLSFLYQHSVKPEFTVRYHWTAGDVGFWDNRATQHSVVGDFGDQHRVIQRVTIKGDVPV